MKSKRMKHSVLIAAAFVGFLGTVQADTYANTTQPRISDSAQMTERPPTREITPDAAPRVAHGADVFITADFIWWKSVQEGTQYAFSGFKNPQRGDAFTPAPKGKVKDVGDDWSPGFKVGLGINMSHDGWDLYAQYTWLRPSNSNSISGGDVFAQTHGIGNADLFILGESASADWDLSFNVIDLELGRNFYLSQFLTMRPFIGFKGTWQDQNYKWSFNASDFKLQGSGGAVSVTGPYRSNQSYDVWGIGARGGFNVAWYMSRNWSFYGDIAYTALWSDYHNQRRVDQMDDSTTKTSTTVVHVDNDAHFAVKSIAELELGLRWDVWFSDDNYHFAIQAGWEEQVWLNWNHFVEFFDDVWNDLNFHGLNLKFRFDF